MSGYAEIETWIQHYRRYKKHFEGHEDEKRKFKVACYMLVQAALTPEANITVRQSLLDLMKRKSPEKLIKRLTSLQSHNMKWLNDVCKESEHREEAKLVHAQNKKEHALKYLCGEPFQPQIHLSTVLAGLPTRPIWSPRLYCGNVF